MNIELSPYELRVLGCLIEKQVTTPEQYPLSLNALVNACNQKSNRDPVLELTDAQVQAAVDTLSRKHLILEKSGFGSRVAKYQQRFCNTEFSVFQFTPQQRAIVCELLLRGAQTPGELRSRAARMATFADAQEVEQALVALSRREGGALVRQEPLEPGRRETRYRHLFDRATDRAAEPPAGPGLEAPAAPDTLASPDATAGAAAAQGRSDAGGLAAQMPPEWAARVTLLEHQVAQLREELAALERRG